MRGLAAATIAALLLAVPAAAQYDDPGVFISPPTGTYNERTQTVRITWSHEYDLVSTSRVIRFNNNVVTGNFTYQPQTSGNVNGSGVRATSTGTVTLADGANTVSAYICGSGSGCTEEVVTMTYLPPPPPAQRTSPVVSLAPYHAGYSNPVRHGSTLTYTTPSYVSLDRERSVTLYYSSELAEPRPLIQFDVTDHSLEPAHRYEVRVLNGGAALTLSNGSTVAVFSNAGGATGGTCGWGWSWPPRRRRATRRTTTPCRSPACGPAARSRRRRPRPSGCR
ncbi:MAG TPA: hypothetical protein VHG93_19700 [Longimicrobium sp.]|nr:hypothetical protein [Longimicrobium sp.]